MPKAKNKPKTVESLMRTKAYKKLRSDMLDDLEARGVIGQQYADKVEEYMQLWCYREMLHEDIKKRGVAVEYQNSATQKGVTENKSLNTIARISSQMLSIWGALGFREAAASGKPAPGMDDDDL